MTFLKPTDLAPFADIDAVKASAMIEDAEATATMVAPCLADQKFLLDATRVAYVKAVLRGAVLRWHESGSGAFQTQTAGPFSVGMDTRQQRRGMFWPSEIEQLQDVCKRFNGASSGRRAYAVDMLASDAGSTHRDICSLHFGGPICSCGADIAGEPIYEGGGW